MYQESRRNILLTFDLEEFDLPLEYDIDILSRDQLNTGLEGLRNVMEVLDEHPAVKATFFTTALFGKTFPDEIRKISRHHEIASHTYYNSYFRYSHLRDSRLMLEKIISAPVSGLRMPQMQSVSLAHVAVAGYMYDSSLHPTYLPGHYNHLKKPRSFFQQQGILEIPASVSANLRIPLFWLSFKNFPYAYFKFLAMQALRKDGYLNIYLHPWEFTDLSAYKIPWFIKSSSKEKLTNKLHQFIKDFSSDAEFITVRQFAERVVKNNNFS